MHFTTFLGFLFGILVVTVIGFGEIKGCSLTTTHCQKIFLAMKLLPTIRKTTIFNRIREVFFVRPKNTWILSFCQCWFERDQKSQFKNKRFPKIFFYIETFKHVPTLCKKIFSTG